MFQFCRKYTFLLIALMSVFVVVLFVDELGDYRRAIEDLRIETCLELEMTDYEWDERISDNGDGQIRVCLTLCDPKTYIAVIVNNQVRTASLLSDELKRGQVRRYAPRKVENSNNYILTALQSVSVMLFY